MSKLIVSANSIKHMELLLDKDIYGIMLYIDKLSVNASFYVDVDEFEKMDFKEKKIFVVMNKIMHNSDLVLVREVLSKLKNKECKILFYDIGVYNIAREMDMVDKLVIYQDHLNASINSNKFYYDLGIKGSYITSDITGEELLEINKSSDMEIYFLGYGYAPIFYSRRYLVKNYLKFINEEEKDGKYLITSDTGVEYPIDEEGYGTAIYSPRPINLINYLDYLDSISYIVMNSNLIDDNEFNLMVDKFINRDKVTSPYVGFFNVKTIYKIKNN